MEKLIPNVSITWQRADRSACIVDTLVNNRRWILARADNKVLSTYSEYGIQLPDEVFYRYFQAMLGLARVNLDTLYHYIRLDCSQVVPENENNRPFILETSPRYFKGAENKTIHIFGYEADQGISGRIDNHTK